MKSRIGIPPVRTFEFNNKREVDSERDEKKRKYKVGPSSPEVFALRAGVRTRTGVFEITRTASACLVLPLPGHCSALEELHRWDPRITSCKHAVFRRMIGPLLSARFLSPVARAISSLSLPQKIQFSWKKQTKEPSVSSPSLNLHSSGWSA